jgi:hypothetical protein
MLAEIIRHHDSESLKPLFSEQHADYNIDIGEFKVSDEALYTIGAGPCIVIAGYNYDSGNGLMGHFSAISSKRKQGSVPIGPEPFGQAVETLSQLGDPKATEIWLGGGAPFVFLGIDTVKSHRDHARRVVADHLEDMQVASRLLNFRWTSGANAIDVELNCHDGRLVVHEYPIEPLLPQWVSQVPGESQAAIAEA